MTFHTLCLLKFYTKTNANSSSQLPSITPLKKHIPTRKGVDGSTLECDLILIGLQWLGPLDFTSPYIGAVNREPSDIGSGASRLHVY